jgi:hypothetical protein
MMAVITKFKACHETGKSGLDSEELFMELITQMTTFELHDSKCQEELPKEKIVFVKTPQEVDETDHIDFFVHHPNLGWINVDLTTNFSTKSMVSKRMRENQHIYVLGTHKTVLQRAVLGCERDIEFVLSALRDLFLFAAQQTCKE